MASPSILSGKERAELSAFFVLVTAVLAGPRLELEG